MPGGPVGVRHAEDGGEWAHEAPALRVELRQCEVLIGPLVLPGRAGCALCASARIAAAEAAARLMDGESEPSTFTGDAAGVALSLLAEELELLHNAPLEQSRLLGHVRIADLRTGRATQHRVIPLPHCTVCGFWQSIASCDLPDELGSLPPEEVLGRLAGFVDSRTGIISRMEFEPSEAPIVVTASPPFVMDEAGSLRRLPIGWGKGLSMSGAILSAVGETLERYAASLPDPASIAWKRPADLDGEFLDPAECALYADRQYDGAAFPFARFNREVPHPWVRGRWLGTNAPVWVPAVFTFLSLKLLREQQICQGTSNGLAAAADFDEAALRAVCELIERDAFLSAWLTASTGLRLEPDDALEPELRQVLAAIEAMGASVELYLLETSACGSAVLALALGDGENYPGATIGIGADLDPRSAVRQAILELGQTGPHLRRLMQSRAVAVPQRASSVREMIDHAAFYFPPVRAAAFHALRSGALTVALSHLLQQGSPVRSLSNCAGMLRAAGIRVALVDVTSADVATGPFRVVRAVSPDLQPISYGYGFDRVPVERVRRLGLSSQAPPVHPIW